jgi:hypothetical protein
MRDANIRLYRARSGKYEAYIPGNGGFYSKDEFICSTDTLNQANEAIAQYCAKCNIQYVPIFVFKDNRYQEQLATSKHKEKLLTEVIESLLKQLDESRNTLRDIQDIIRGYKNDSD